MENIERLFYYTSERIVSKTKQQKASAKHWHGMLKKRISEEEEKHLGILQWLEEQGGSQVNKEDILIYINQNRLKITEIILSEDAIHPIRKKYTTGQLTNYREIVITVPDLEEYYSDEIHFSDVSNGQDICWCRCADYYMVDCKILVIDEMQSYRHQDAHKYGYKSEFTNYWSDDVVKYIMNDSSLSINERCEKLNKYYEATYANSVAVKNAVPDTPFRKWWQFLSKRMLQYAVSNGYTQMRITSGEIQMQRYVLDEKENNGIKNLYDKIIIGYFTKYLKQWNISPYIHNNWWCIDLNPQIKEDISTNLQPLLKSTEDNDCGYKINLKEDLLPKFDDLHMEYITHQDINMQNVLGWYDRANEWVYVVVNNHSNIKQLNTTIVHEVLAHYGLKKLLGEEYLFFLDAIYQNLMKKDERDNYLLKYRNWLTAVEEYCADIFEKKPQKSSYEKLGYIFLKEAFENLGLENELTDMQLWEVINLSRNNLLNK